MSYDIRVERVDSRLTAVLRLRAGLGELPKVVPQACGTVCGTSSARTRSPARDGTWRFYQDDEMNLEVGVEMEAPFAGAGEVVASSLPRGIVATTTHYGPYPLLSRAHEAIGDWCATNGHVKVGPNWEIYDHWNDEWNRDPSRIRTDVFYLLRNNTNSESH